MLNVRTQTAPPIALYSANMRIGISEMPAKMPTKLRTNATNRPSSDGLRAVLVEEVVRLVEARLGQPTHLPCA